jgi:hypothetical protein
MLGKVQVEAMFDRQDNPDHWNELNSVFPEKLTVQPRRRAA